MILSDGTLYVSSYSLLLSTGFLKYGAYPGIPSYVGSQRHDRVLYKGFYWVLARWVMLPKHFVQLFVYSNPCIHNR